MALPAVNRYLYALLASLVLIVRTFATTVYDNPITGYFNDPQISQNWGAGAPFFSVAVDGVDPTPPGCTINFVNILSRHGSRFPTSGVASSIETALAKVNIAVQNSSVTLPSEYLFLRNFTYTLGEAILTHFGQQEMYNSGLKFFERYGFLDKETVPFVRASSSARVVQSAENFTQGFNFEARESGPEYKLISEDSILVLIEGTNDTLLVETCNAWENDPPYSTVDADEDQVWIDIFSPSITARLNSNLPGANLDVNDTVALMQLCYFETIATTYGTISPFCYLFTDDEWVDFEFYEDLDKWFGNGPGNLLGPTQGVGWVNELIARLTNTPVMDHTSTNTTLDSSNVTFPLGLSLYADFSHDTQLTSIFSALGLFDSAIKNGGLNASDLNSRIKSGYSSAKTVPFAGRAYFEKMACQGSDEEMVRILVNDAVQPLEFCGGDSYGRCALSKFVESQGFARSGGLWTECT